MWMLQCVLCVLTFPQPTAADRAAIHGLIPGLGSPPVEDAGRPWSEMTGPYLAERIQLLTPEFGVVRVGLTWRAGSIAMQEPGGTVFVVTKRDGAWQLNAIMER